MKFKFDYDTEAAVTMLSGADKQLAQLIKRVGPFTIEIREMLNPFQALMRSIVYQQLSGKAAETIYNRVVALFPNNQTPQPKQILDIPAEKLRGAGMSRAKVAAVKDLAEKTLSGVVPSLAQLKKMHDDEIISRIVAVRGIGEWTVQMLLMFRLGRPDILPVTDLGVRKGFMLTYNTEKMPTPGELQKYGEKWRPYRSVASWYLWRAVDLSRKEAE